MKKTSVLFPLFLLATSLVTSGMAKDSSMPIPLPKNAEDKLINKDVQLKGNGWLTILGEEYSIVTEQIFYERMLRDGYKDFSKPKNPDDIVGKYIWVNVQFLKPCDASWDKEEESNFSKYMNAVIDGKKPPVGLTGIPPLPYYKCDYRVKLFITFFGANGMEIKTEGQFINARGEKGTNKYKLDMFPGEKTYGMFSVPENTAYYYTWVPK
jgi:hypothetical protein